MTTYYIIEQGSMIVLSTSIGKKDRGFSVQGIENVSKAHTLHETGLTFNNIARCFCGNCGNYVPIPSLGPRACECARGYLQQKPIDLLPKLSSHYNIPDPIEDEYNKRRIK